jgi:hypothetical protein
LTRPFSKKDEPSLHATSMFIAVILKSISGTENTLSPTI